MYSSPKFTCAQLTFFTENLLACNNSISDIFIKYQSQATFWNIASSYKKNNSKHILQ